MNPESETIVYRHFKTWSDWSMQYGIDPFRPRLGDVFAFIEEQEKSGKARSTISQLFWGIAKFCDIFESQEALKARRQLLAKLPKEQKQKHALQWEQLSLLREKTTDDLTGKRDRVLIETGYFTGLGRSVYNVYADDFEVQLETGRILYQGISVPFNETIVRDIFDYLHHAKIAIGDHVPLLRRIRKGKPKKVESTPICAKTVNDVITKLCREVGFDPSDYGGHSLTCGIITDALQWEASPQSIIKWTGIKYFYPNIRPNPGLPVIRALTSMVI